MIVFLTFWQHEICIMQHQLGYSTALKHLYPYEGRVGKKMKDYSNCFSKQNFQTMVQTNSFSDRNYRPGVVPHACNPSTLES